MSQVPDAGSIGAEIGAASGKPTNPARATSGVPAADMVAVRSILASLGLRSA